MLVSSMFQALSDLFQLIPALEASLDEILAQGMDYSFEHHQFIGNAMRAAWKALGLQWVPLSEEHCANSMSNLRAPKGIGMIYTTFK